MANRIYHDDGVIAEIIRKHGGIPFAKTNLPQLVGMPETLNRIWGNTKNPYNPERTVGGSSGGEAALIASA